MEIAINRKVISSTKTKVRYVEMMYPENWNISIRTEREKYGGYLYPYVFRITLTSPDDQRAVSYFSPRDFVDDHLQEFQNDQIDAKGDLLHSFMSIDEYLEMWAKNDLKDREDFKTLEVIIDPDMDKQEEERKNKALVNNRSKGLILQDHYYRKLAKAYSYTFNDTEWVRVYAGIIEAEHVVKYKSMPLGAFASLDKDTKIKLSPYLPKNQIDGNFTYPLIDETRWSVSQLFNLDCKLKDYDSANKDVFTLIRNEEVTICDDILNDYEQIRKNQTTE